MPLGTSFSTKGSVPTPAQTSTSAFGANTFAPRNAYGTVTGAGTPASNALNSAVSKPALPTALNFSTPVKSTKITHPDGTVVEQTSHAPEPTQTGNTAGILSQLSSAQNKLSQAQSAGYQGNEAIQTDASGNIVPKAPTAPYNQAVSGLLNQAENGGASVNKANNDLTQFRENLAGKEAAIDNTGADLNFKQGAGQVLQKAGLIKEAALETGVSNALAGNAQQIQAGSSAGALTSPVQVPYSNQYIDPTTGKPVGGGQAGQLPPEAQTAINSYAQQVKDGKMTREDAESRLSAYGIAGTNALNTALGSDFNTNASNASAGTTQVGQQIKTAADSTNQALDTLTTNFNSLSGIQTGGIPITNSIAQWIGKNLGDKALSTYKTNLADARSQLIGVLNSSGGTPTGNEATANEYLPDNMTKAQFDANVGTAQNPGIVRQLIAQKVGSFTSSGNQNGTTTANPNTNPNGVYDF